MKESASIALDYVKAHAKELNIDPKFFDSNDIHIHVPEGAVPKDGPSAGVTLTTAIVSALTDTPVYRDIAMTGEVTLRGNVLPIGGLREKSLAAHRVGIKKVLIPKNNVRDLDDVPETCLVLMSARLGESLCFGVWANSNTLGCGVFLTAGIDPGSGRIQCRQKSPLELSNGTARSG